MQWEFFISSILTVIGTFAGYMFGRRKNLAEAQKNEIDNVGSSLAIYREMIDDLSLRINKQAETIERQEREIEQLRSEINNLKRQRQ